MRALNPDHLRCFATVIEHGSFSVAAAHLHLTQPAVSLQIKQLERRLGVSLIERIGRRAMPTAAGTELLAHVRRIDGALADALEAMAGHAMTVAGRVRLGTGGTACTYLLPPLLRDLRRRFPSLEIVVSTGNTGDHLKALEDNAIDVGLLTLPAPGRALQVTPVLEDEFVAIFAAGEESIPATATPAAMARLPVVFEDPGSTSRDIVEAWFLRAGRRVKPVMELGHVEATKRLVSAGLGCSILPRMAVIGDGRRDGILVRPLMPKLSRRLGVVLRRDKPLQRGLRELVNALLALEMKGR
jgi:DNA-binding transcriptional LysR family regulator